MNKCMTLKPYLVLLLFTLFVAQAVAQDSRVTVNLRDVSLVDVFNAIEEQTTYRFSYRNVTVSPERNITVSRANVPVSTLLSEVLAGRNLGHNIVSNQSIVIYELRSASEQNTQSITVQGRVVDIFGDPVIGASVVDVNNPSLGAVTNFDGEYTLSGVRSNSALAFSFIGMTTQTINVGGRTTINVTMDDDAATLGEVVVTALGMTREARSLGYAISSISGADMTAGRESNMMSALAGRVAGVSISGTSAGPSGSQRVVIRGASQLTGSNQPLFVIDGVPMDNTQLGEAGRWGGFDLGDGLSSLNPDDIESVSVLRGAAAAALYGSRASNGVILITTRQGRAQDNIGIEITTSLDAVTMLTRLNDYQRVFGQGRNGQLPMTLQDATSTTVSAWGAKLDPDIDIMIFNGQRHAFQNVENNIMSFFRTGLTLTNAIAMSGGNETSAFRVSISDMRNIDIVPNSDMSRTTFMVRGDTRLGKRMRVESRVNYTNEIVNNRPALSDSPGNVGLSLIGLAPNFHQSWLGENYIDEFGRYIDWNGGNRYRINPYWIMSQTMNHSVRDRVMGHIQLNYEINDWLNLRVRSGTDFFNFTLTDFQARYTPNAESGRMAEHRIYVQETNHEAVLSFNRRFDINHNSLDVGAFVGGNIQQNRSQGIVNVGRDQVLPGVISIANYQMHDTPAPLFRAKQVNSLFGAVNLGWNDFLYLDFTIRNDVSSTLHRDYRSYVYPSVSGSFVFTSLFDLRSTPISFGRVRASWAQVGGDTDPYQLSMNYNLANFTFHGTALGQIQGNTLLNPRLKPTTTVAHELGFDIRFFNNRIGLDVTYYNQATRDQIMRLPISRTSGFSYAMINAGEIVNRGLEVTLNAAMVQTRDFDWNANFNFSLLQSQVTSLHPEVEHFELAQARWANAFIYATAGQAFGSIMGPGFARCPNGEIIHQNGLPTFSNELQVFGNGVHNLVMGLGNNIRWRRINAGVLFDGRFGAQIYSMSDMLAHANGNAMRTLEGREGWNDSEEQRMAANVSLAEWTPTGGKVGQGVMNIGTAENPVFVPNDVYVNPQSYWTTIMTNTAEPFIHNASFIKLRELTLSYDINPRIFGNNFIQSASLSLYGRNLFILYSNLKNIDPESNYNSGNGQGFEHGSLPSRRNFGMALNLRF